MTTESRTPSISVDDAPAARSCACLSRRHALAGVAAVGVGVPFLAACGGDEASSGAESPSTPTSSAPSSDGASTPTDGASSGGAPAGLTTTADIPVGGGTIFADEDVVIVQPTEGEFLAWSATCTHQGCQVTSVDGGSIVCSCHNSTFSIEDGSVQGGPATSPLGEVAITVDGDAISLA